MVQFTEEQENLISKAINWFNNSSEQIFEYAGSAGTGKTLVASEIINRLNLSFDNVAPCAYTGAASIVLRTKGLVSAKTIHSWIYEPKTIIDYTKPPNYLGRYPTKVIFVKKDLPRSIKLILVDEAGYVPMNIKKDLESTGIKILACGDLNQLPPIMSDPGFLTDNSNVHRLTKIMRQGESSPIVYIANLILQDKPIQSGHYGNVYVCYPDDITDEMMKHSDAIICGKNNTRDHYNKQMRILKGIDPDSKMPHHNEKIICRKNNWQYAVDGINLANGLSGKVYSYPDITCYDGKTYQIDFKPNLLNCLFKDIRCNAEFFHASRERKEELKTIKYGVDGELFELGYAITTHIAQGSQFKHGMYISEYMTKEINKHLDYTGITRFSNTCIYILKPRKFY